VLGQHSIVEQVVRSIVELVAIGVQLVDSIGSTVVEERAVDKVGHSIDLLVLGCGAQRYRRSGSLDNAKDQLLLGISLLTVPMHKP
jgi:hypothetical protein